MVQQNISTVAHNTGSLTYYLHDDVISSFNLYIVVLAISKHVMGRHSMMNILWLQICM